MNRTGRQAIAKHVSGKLGTSQFRHPAYAGQSGNPTCATELNMRALNAGYAVLDDPTFRKLVSLGNNGGKYLFSPAAGLA